jgi:hypothetical protein
MAPVSNRGTIRRKRIGVLFEAGVNRWDMRASKALKQLRDLGFKMYRSPPIREIWKKFTSLEQRSETSR